jgi:hypothetical protein
MIPRNVVRVLIGAALLGITFLSVAALKLAMPSSGAADSRAEKHDAAPKASRETTLRGCDETQRAEQSLGAPTEKLAPHRLAGHARRPGSSCGEHAVDADAARTTGGSFRKPSGTSGWAESRACDRAEPDAGGGAVGVSRTLSIVPMDVATW